MNFRKTISISVLGGVAALAFSQHADTAEQQTETPLAAAAGLPDLSDPKGELILEALSVSGEEVDTLAEELANKAREGLGLPDPDDEDAVVFASLDTGYQPSPEKYNIYLKAQPAQQVKGQARALSGGAIKISDMNVSIEGIRAPEKGTICVSGKGVTYDCSYWSKTSLQAALDEHVVSCKAYVEIGKSDRAIGSCAFLLSDGKRLDVGEWVAMSGVGFADHNMEDMYVSYENKARDAKVGLWSGDPGI